MNKPLSSNLLAPFEAIINRCIAQDLKLCEAIAQHSGKTLLLNITAPPLSVLVHFYASSVTLSFAPGLQAGAPGSNQEQQTPGVDGSISGSALAMLRLLTEREKHRALVNPAIQIGGDSEFVQSVYRMFLTMEIDWQEPLSRVIGDIPTQGLEQLLNRLGTFTMGTMDSIRRNVDEYLHEESRLVPALTQVETFDRQLDALRLRLDRLQARIQRLSRQRAEARSNDSEDSAG